MSWKPRHEAHAIERVRVMIPFKDPLTTKVLRSASADAVARAHEFGFDTLLPAESTIGNILITPSGAVAPQKVSGQENGVVLKRQQDGSVIEEVGFRDGTFGYVSATYGRWENLLGRLREVVLPTLQNVEQVADLASVKLEYWDSFHFDGDPANADTTHILEQVDASIPPNVVTGGSQWHSHIGWFEDIGGFQVLINRNIDVADRKGEADQVRSMTIYTMVEIRAGNQSLEIVDIEGHLDTLHRRSLRLFGETLSEVYRGMIGLNLADYQ